MTQQILNKLAFELFVLNPLIDLKNIPSYEKSLNQFFEEAEDLVSLFRKDLNAKVLNKTLFKRIKKKIA